MTRNMVHRALVTLHYEGFLFKIHETGRFVLSYNMALMQNATRPVPALKDFARPYVEAIAEELGETVQLTARSGDFQTVIDGVEGRGHLGLRVKIGRAIPLHLSAGSRAILAALSDEEIAGYIARNEPLTGTTAESLTTADAIGEEVRNVRQQGYSLAFGDFSPNTAGIGYAILDIDGRPHGALIVGGPGAANLARLGGAGARAHRPDRQRAPNRCRALRGSLTRWTGSRPSRPTARHATSSRPCA